MQLPQLPPRAADAHKGNFGHALLIGGSPGMAGAISLSAMAALRSGAGLVTVATPIACQAVVAGFEPSYMTIGLPSDQEGRIGQRASELINQLAAKCTAVGCGPGMQVTPEIVSIVARLYGELTIPMVVDADALNALAQNTGILPQHAAPRILTPHPGEFARLLGVSRIEASQRSKLAENLARQANVVVVLKGHRTIVTDGNRTYVNTTGNPGMATGGCGDVLTGIITALICQGMSPLDAAQLGTFLHGRAGDVAADAVGQVSLIASDLIKFLPAAFQSRSQP